MVNNQIKNTVAPWQEKGRWYHAFIESSDAGEKITVCDIEGCTISSSNFVLPAGYHVVDVKYVDCDLAGGKNITTYGIATTSSHLEFFKLPSASDFTYCDVWFYAIYKEV